MVELLFLLSFLVELQSNCFRVNLDSILMNEWISSISLFSERPIISWISLLAPPLLHIIGFGFSHVLLTTLALFFSSFFFSLTISKTNPNSSTIDSKTQEQDLGQQESLVFVKTTSTIDIFMDDDDTIPDEESLIELSLPGGHYVGTINNNIQDFRFIQVNDIIEDDNFIEIDLSVGSIKCSSFEIKA